MMIAGKKSNINHFTPIENLQYDRSYKINNPPRFDVSLRSKKMQNDDEKSTFLKSIQLFLKKSLMKVPGLLLFALTLFPLGVFAKSKGNSEFDSQSNKKKSTGGTQTQLKNKNVGTANKDTKVNKKASVEIILVDDKKLTKEKSSQDNMTKIGFVATGIVLVAILLFDGNTQNVSNKKKVSKNNFSKDSRISPESFLPKRDLDLNVDDFLTGDDSSSSSKKSITKKLNRLKTASSTDELYSDEDEEVLPKKLKSLKPNIIQTSDTGDDKEIDDVSTPSNLSGKKFGRLSFSKNFVSSDDDNEKTQDQNESLKKSQDESFSSLLDAAAPSPAPVPAPVKEKKGFLSRIFQRSEDTRPIALSEAIKTPADPSYDYRCAVAGILSHFVIGEFPEYESEFGFLSSTKSSSDKAAYMNSIISKRKNDCGIEDQDAANAFAEVTNAMLVALVDKVANLVDSKNEDEEETLRALDRISDFIRGAGTVFSATLSNVTIEPVVYTGKIKKGKLEALYYRYCKAAMNMGNVLASDAAAGVDASGDGSSAEQAEGDASVGANDAEDESSTGTAGTVSDSGDSGKSVDARLDTLPLIQQVLTIKESKRSSIEQKIVKEMVMSAMSGKGGAEGFGDIGQMMESFMGADKGAGGMGGMDPKVFSDMMAKGGGLPDMEAFGGDMAKSLEGMDPSEMEALSKNAVSELKESLAAGAVGLDEVEELEKMIGIKLEDFVKMMDKANAGQNLKPEMKDMFDVFKKLADVKKKSK